MNETERRLLRRIRDEGAEGIRRSSLPKSCGQLIESLTVCGAVRYQPASAGRGVVLAIQDVGAFHSFVSARLPHGLDVSVDDVVDRTDAIFKFADAKVIRASSSQGVFVRSAKIEVDIEAADGSAVVPVGKLTHQAGGTGLQLSASRTWRFAGSIALIENIDAFWKYEVVLPDVDLAVFASGKVSNLLINWITGPSMAHSKIVHWGDYDPVGVSEYLRLRRACGDRVTTFAPPGLEDLFPKYGKKKLITRQQRYMDRIRLHESDPYVRRMLSLFDRHRRGLEQEALLRDRPDAKVAINAAVSPFSGLDQASGGESSATF